MNDSVIKRALISVANKNHIIAIANALHAHKVELLATGGTANLLQEHKLPAQEVSEFTGYPEILQGRVKTLHPKVFAGILARRKVDGDVMAQMAITPIDLLIVNLYPFEKTIQNKHTLEDAIENIDIGGVSLIRAAAKNYNDVTIIVDPNDYEDFINKFNGETTYQQRLYFAKKAFAYVTWYDQLISNYFANIDTENEMLPDRLQFNFTKKTDLRYGENPQQKAALYMVEGQLHQNSVANVKQLQGKEISFNNLLDASTAYECVSSFTEPACVIVKHANPCGAACAENTLKAYNQAYQTDPTSAFGGIIAFNNTLDVKTAETIINNQFVEVIIAPQITAEALTIFSTKPNVRVLSTNASNNDIAKSLDIRCINGGILIQETDDVTVLLDQLRVVTALSPTQTQLHDLIFAWRIVKFVKSNAIVFAKDKETIGIGAGQMSRIDSVMIAASKAQRENLSLQNTVMASDAFFPFRDTIDKAAELGIKAIIQPGGSMRDAEVIQAANEANIAMVFTGIRHFRH
ncbi:MAG: bifunctional phosphoribosylaminoimidazolecarboxamide formyltransferase/IMP cyclohydrolase [Gammaproteobacteria bacterium]